MIPGALLALVLTSSAATDRPLTAPEATCLGDVLYLEEQLALCEASEKGLLRRLELRRAPAPAVPVAQPLAPAVPVAQPPAPEASTGYALGTVIGWAGAALAVGVLAGVGVALAEGAP